ncbi:MAG: Histidine ammonia-lyase [candidate division TA06 bacterium 32_111]|uniref:Histidine ammonia-lyase n=2 Tax=Bacteria candidate phyla TaxID=1783234 RepID=A0A101I183_UNCT6|nr:MAG: Histidine ammonia-lyase [candidate division TA06 bacterium 32_111]KUK86911.1 MAG: Histidine ammonia-lyase [candidate division TA06 bacterium 34_109]HAF07234.1 histidine ammonia-lyase [candidate division WOR-3 bacterium]HCP16652.1 histidine ammonia-lyase [candidate division WOR-3 bacterium]
MVSINGFNLDLIKFKKVVLDLEKLKIEDSALKRVKESYEVIEKIVNDNRRVYGVTTGFGKLVDVTIPKEKIDLLQFNILRSHSVGVGEPFSFYDVRGAILLRINTIIRGNSGVSLETLNALVELLNKRIYPYVPQKGSVGASGDLAPLSHIALVLIGEGECIEDGKRVRSIDVLNKYKIKPVKLRPKEGLALINGTQMMTSLAGFSLVKSEILLKLSDVVAAASADALLSTDLPFEKRISNIRNHKGQVDSAYNIYNLLKGSNIRRSHKKCSKVQDPYSVRCIPQVHGAAREVFYFAKGIVEREFNSSTDNPLVFIKEKDVVSAGNFHGQIIATALDSLTIGLCELGNISDRRLYRLLDTNQTGLYPFLIKDVGLNSGFMMLQVTTAALVSENKVLAHPASVDSIPTSLGQEDHVSMGTISARKLKSVIENNFYILSIELFAAMTALYLRKPLLSSKPLNELLNWFFKKVEPVENDRAFYLDVEKIFSLTYSGEVVEKVENYLKLK